MDELYIQTLTWMRFSQLLGVVRFIILYCTDKSNLKDIYNVVRAGDVSSVDSGAVRVKWSRLSMCSYLGWTVPNPCIWMYSTCTSMTWSHYIINTRGQVDLLKFGSACSTLFKNSLSLIFCWFNSVYVWSVHQCFWDAPELHQTRQVKSSFKGRLPLKSNRIQLNLRFTAEEWKAWLSLMVMGVTLYIGKGRLVYSSVALPVMPAQGLSRRGGVEA